MNKKKITAFNYVPTSAGPSVTFHFSEIDLNGNIVKENVCQSFIVMDKELETNLNKILAYLQKRIDTI